MKAILTAGGTAGHINPAIAIAEEIKSIHHDAKILFVGREGGFENDLIKKAGFEYKTINIQGLKRGFSLVNFKKLYLALEAKSKAKEIIKEFKPDIILGTGGYVCWPIISVGADMKIPSAIHESNYAPGLTTKLLAKKCNVVFLNNAETKKLLPNGTKTVVSGTPLLQSFLQNDRAKARQKLGIGEKDVFIASFGGSIGSEKMNETILEVIKKYSSKEKIIKHLHATGQQHFESIKKNFSPDEKSGCEIVPYIHNMSTVLHAADIVITRCGAVTLSELAAVGVASILIPSPNVAENHQFKNAKALSDDGSAILIEEKNLSFESLKNAIDELKNDEFGRKKRAKSIKGKSKDNSAKIIVKELLSLKNG